METALQKIILTSSTLTADFDRSIFESVSYSLDPCCNYHDIAERLRGKHPYTITVLIESLKYEYRKRKEFVITTRIPTESKYHHLLYDYFFAEYGESEGNIIYSKWLDIYNPLHAKERKYEFVDEYIFKHELEPRYKDRILKRYRNRDKLFRKSFRLERKRRYNLPEPLNYVDWRNSYDTIFIWEQDGHKVARKGGSGSSGGREINSKFIYGLLELSKSQPIPSYLFLYSEKNELLFIRKFERLCVPFIDIGENYHIKKTEADNLFKQGLFIWWDRIDKVSEIQVGSYKAIL